MNNLFPDMELLILAVYLGPQYSESIRHVQEHVQENILPTVHGRIMSELRTALVQLSHFANKGIKYWVSQSRLVTYSESTQKGNDTAIRHTEAFSIRSKWLLFNHSVVSNSLRLHGLQHIRLPCPSSSPRVCSNSCPLSWWCHHVVILKA